MKIGQTIAKIRKERGITQEQLGKALGISSQAVSKWENGGSPDTEMLPEIADTLGVTIDTLYGRSNEPHKDMKTTLLNWLSKFPKEKRMYKLFSLLCCTLGHPYYVDINIQSADGNEIIKLPVSSCYSIDASMPQQTAWFRSAIILDNGIQLAIPAEDCPLFMVMPEPVDGYELHFSDNEEYRTLFSTLAMPGALEILRTLYARKSNYRSKEAIAKAAHISVENTEKILVKLTECNILKRTEVELEDTPIETYSLKDNGYVFVPFMLLSRWLNVKNDSYLCYWNDRNKPILTKEQKNEKQ